VQTPRAGCTGALERQRPRAARTGIGQCDRDHSIIPSLLRASYAILPSLGTTQAERKLERSMLFQRAEGHRGIPRTPHQRLDLLWP